MEFEPRPRRKAVEPDVPWYNEPLSVVGVVVVVFALCFGIVQAYKEYRERQAIEALGRIAEGMRGMFEPHPPREAQPRYVDRVVQEHIPGRSIEACKAETGGEINERFAKCRSGYSVTRTVRESR